MQNLNLFLFAGVLLLFQYYCWSGCKALECQNSNNDTIIVDKSGHGNFTSVQSAINSIPEGNTHWIHIQISPGKYTEKVTISVNKPCIILQGTSSRSTSIEWGDYEETSTSATFTSNADNIIAKFITFKNTYEFRMGLSKFNWREGKSIWKQAVAARIRGDKSAFFECGFLGIQDTLWDEQGRHHYSRCYIEGAVDFIFGKARTRYEKCIISVNIGRYESGATGFITAQKKEWPDQLSGFVFNSCVIKGIGKAYLGRAWGPYSTVIINRSLLSEIIVPEGWNAWDYVNHEANFTYVEANNFGKGADTSKRVPWTKKLSTAELRKYLDNSYVNEDGWLDKIPKF